MFAQPVPQAHQAVTVRLWKIRATPERFSPAPEPLSSSPPQTTTPRIPHGELGQCSARLDAELRQQSRLHSGFGTSPSRWISIGLSPETARERSGVLGRSDGVSQDG